MMDAQFLDECYVRVTDEVEDGRTRFELTRPFSFWSAVLGEEVIVPRFFICDGPSIPAAAVPAVGSQTIGFKAAVIHDWMLVSNRWPREVCDRVYLEALRCCVNDEGTIRKLYAGVRFWSLTLEPLPQGPEMNA